MRSEGWTDKFIIIFSIAIKILRLWKNTKTPRFWVKFLNYVVPLVWPLPLRDSPTRGRQSSKVHKGTQASQPRQGRTTVRGGALLVFIRRWGRFFSASLHQVTWSIRKKSGGQKRSKTKVKLVSNLWGNPLGLGTPAHVLSLTNCLHSTSRVQRKVSHVTTSQN